MLTHGIVIPHRNGQTARMTERNHALAQLRQPRKQLRTRTAATNHMNTNLSFKEMIWQNVETFAHKTPDLSKMTAFGRGTELTYITSIKKGGYPI